MAAQDMELWQLVTPATSADIQQLTSCVLGIWAHPRVQAGLGRYSLGETIWTDFQNMGATDLKLGFSTDSQTYPDISVYTEQSHSGFEELPEDADLVSSTCYEFTATRKLFGLPKYRAKYVNAALSIEDSELSPELGVIPDVAMYNNLTRTQRTRILKGRKQQPTKLTIGQTRALRNMLNQYDPDLVQLQPEGNER